MQKLSWLNRLKISERLKCIFIIMMGIILISSIFSLVSFQAIGNNMKTFYHIQYETTKNQMEIRKDVQTINKRLLWAIICNDPKVTKEQQDDLQSRFSKIEGYIAVIHKNLADKQTGETLTAAWQDFQEDTNLLISMLEDDDVDKAVAYYQTTYSDVSEVLADALDTAGIQSDKAAEQQYNSSTRIQAAVSVILIILSVFAFLISFLLEKRLTKGMVAPLNEIENAAKEISQGHLQISIQYTGEDEIGSVAESLRSSIKKIASYIEDIDSVMAAMADGNFKISLSQEFIGDFRNIEKSMKFFMDRMSSNLRDIEQVSVKVDDGSRQISSESQALADRATNQAAIVEELSATTSSITQQINRNTQSTVEISREIESVVDGISHSNDKMQEVVRAMETIDQTSQEIRRIIDTINEIASQTNLLSLNASI